MHEHEQIVSRPDAGLDRVEAEEQRVPFVFERRALHLSDHLPEGNRCERLLGASEGGDEQKRKR
jgi:hypothetical protein